MNYQRKVRANVQGVDESRYVPVVIVIAIRNVRVIGLSHTNQIGGYAPSLAAEMRMMFRQRYDDVGFPCKNRIGSPSPTSM